MHKLSCLLLLAALSCTRSNPDAFTFGVLDLAAPPLPAPEVPGDLATSGGGDDLARARDLATAHPLAVWCTAALTCSGVDSACCRGGGPDHCTDPMTPVCGGSLFECDGPEDCSTAASDVCCFSGTGSGPGSIASRCTARLGYTTGELMCHSLSDCPAGYVNCCIAVPNTSYGRCC
jgi:hypothetical protein